MRWEWSLGDKGELEVIDDSIHYGEVGEEGDDAHRAATLRTDQGTDFAGLRFILHVILYFPYFNLIAKVPNKDKAGFPAHLKQSWLEPDKKSARRQAAALIND